MTLTDRYRTRPGDGLRGVEGAELPAGYSVRILDDARERAPKEPLPMVIPVVLHHHRGGWKVAARPDPS